MIKAVFFDVDGTLVDSNEAHVAAWQEAFRQRDFDVEQEAIRGQIGKGGDLLVPTLLPETSTEIQHDLADRHGTVFKDKYLEQVRPFPDAAALVRHVHEQGQRIVLASSAGQNEVDHYLSLLEIAAIVDATTTIDDAGTSKPAGDIFAAALRKVQPLTSDEVVVVGDSPYDIEAAAKCGIGTIAVRSGGFDDEVLMAAGPIEIYDDASDLLRRYELSSLRKEARERS